MFQINPYGCHPVVLITKQTRLIQSTQHRFILIKWLPPTCVLHVSVCTETTWGILCMVFVLTWLWVADVQAEICSLRVRETSQIKINLWVRLNKCGLFSFRWTYCLHILRWQEVPEVGMYLPIYIGHTSDEHNLKIQCRVNL
jgi:hypothetical protein